MKNIDRFGARLAAFATAFLIFVPLATAQSPFDGTWRTSTDENTLPPMVYLLQNGIYQCKACNPEGQIQANGQDQPITPQPAYNTINVREIDLNSIEIIGKKGGKVMSDTTRIVSADGNTMTEKVVNSFVSSQPLTSEFTYTRITPGPAGANMTSGSWQRVGTQVNESALLTTFKSNGNGLDMSTPGGNRYSAKFDGNEYPVVVSLPNVKATVSLKLINDHSFEETRKYDGAVMFVRTYTVSDDGKKMTIATKNLRTGAGGDSVAYKQ